MPKYLVVTLVLILLCFAGYSTTKPTVKHVIKVLSTDSSKVTVRAFNKDTLQQYINDKDFQYDEGATAKISLWARFWHWFWHLLGRIFSVPSGKWTLFTYIEYFLLIVAVAFLIYIVLKIAGIDVVRLFKGQAKKVEIPYTESVENIHEISFDDEIEKAIGNRNYKLAVRLLYLRSLKQLSDAQLIHWQIEKTNTAYVNEITDTEQRRFFTMLTRQFEYVWYGNFFIDSASFQNINTLFQDFKRLLA